MFSVRTSFTSQFLIAVFFLLCAFTTCPSFGAAESNAEELFTAARGYAVKIRTSVSTPFPGDDKGTFYGAGFVVDRQRGWVVTNAHVVSRSNSSIQLASLKFEYEPASVIYIDPVFDIAIITSKSVQILDESKLDCKMDFSVGAPVGAFGHPWGTDYTGTKGIVSTITSDMGFFGEYVQTDAPINPGNSGGPLIHLRTGKIIGMNTAGKEKAQNMNYAVTAEEICDVVQTLQSGKDPTPPRLGLAFFKDTDNKNTLHIAKVTSKTNPFGFAVGDTIVSIKGENKKLTTEPQLLSRLRKYSLPVTLVVRRAGSEIELNGRFDQIPAIIGRSALHFSGILIKEPEDNELVDLMASKIHVAIGYVESGSLGDNRNFSAGDLIELVNGQEVKDMASLNLVLQQAVKTGAKIKMRLKRPSFDQGRVFSYVEREVDVMGLEIVEVGRPSPVAPTLIQMTAQEVVP